MQGEHSWEHRVAKETRGILAGMSLAAAVAEKETEKRHAGQQRSDRKIAGWKRRWVKPQLNPVSAQMEAAELHPSSPGRFWVPWR